MEKIKQKDGSFHYRGMFWYQGKAIKSPVFSRKTDCNEWIAKQKANKVIGQIYGHQRKLIDRMSLADYCDFWLEAKKSQGAACSTMKNYESYIRVHIKPFFKLLDIKEIQKTDIQKFQIELRKDHNAKGTNLIVGALRSIFREAQKDEYLIKNPCEYIKALKQDPKVDNYWSPQEIQQFLTQNYEHELYELFLVAMNTGMRRGELAGLCWDRVDFEKRIIFITRTRNHFEFKDRPKNGRNRTIAMNDEVFRTLKNLKNKNLNSEFVFITPKGQPIDTNHLYRDFKLAQRNANMSRELRFHDLRHTYASAFVNSGRSIYSLQQLLGHTDVKMTQRYAHHSVEALHESMKGFSLGSVRDLSTNNFPTPIETENIIDFKNAKSELANQNLTILNSTNEKIK